MGSWQRLALGSTLIVIASPPIVLAQSSATLPAIVIPAEPKGQPRPIPKKQAGPNASASANTTEATAPPAATGPAPSIANWPPSPDALVGPIKLIGLADTASSGIIGQDKLQARSPYRPGEILESIPGLILSQHSGEGKANQYYLRGFNLDHGTDIAIFFDNMPVNMPTHGHGQGYADINFMIPEIARGLSYHKGPYFADEGNFASAGAIHIDYVDKLDRNFGQVEVGSFGYRRGVGAMSAPLGNTANALAAVDLQSYDGPWDTPDDLKKANGVLRLTQGSRDNGSALTIMGYSGKWTSTDQVAKRAVDEGIIDRFGTLDPADGGEARRFSVSARWGMRDSRGATRVSAYVIRQELDLFNNFTYFLDDPVNGDQFHQKDYRTVAGGRASQVFFGTLGGMKTETEIGVQARYDDINNGLFKTKARQQLSTTRADSVEEFTAGTYGQYTMRWTEWFRSVAGLRVDWHQGDVKSTLEANTGKASDSITSPKLNLIFGPWNNTEFYLSGGFGHHSNDLRGATTKIDPATGDPVESSPLLVRSKGAEIGVRHQSLPGLSIASSVFILDYDSEIVFVGDAGTTEASRPSRRIGTEIELSYKILPWLTLDAEYAYTQARFRVDDPLAPGRYIPGSPEGVAKAGLSFDKDGWFGGVNVRYFGPRPLIEDNSVRSKASYPVSARLGYKFSDTLIARLDGYNLFNQKASQIDYYYESQLLGEATSVNDIHFHPLEPTSFRLTVTKLF
jgi:hypothetical protein